MTQVLVFGDSIGWGAWDEHGGWVEKMWQTLVQKNMADPNLHYRLYNLSISGDISTWLLERFKAEAEYRMAFREGGEGTVMIFAIGINDSKFLHNRSATLTPLAQFKANIEKLAKQAKRHVHVSKIVFVGYNPVDEEAIDRFTKPLGYSYRNDYVKEFEDALKQVCEDAGVHFIGIFDKFNVDGYEKLLQDGLHPNTEGHQRIFEIVNGFLSEKNVF